MSGRISGLIGKHWTIRSEMNCLKMAPEAECLGPFLLKPLSHCFLAVSGHQLEDRAGASCLVLNQHRINHYTLILTFIGVFVTLTALLSMSVLNLCLSHHSVILEVSGNWVSSITVEFNVVYRIKTETSSFGILGLLPLLN